MEKTVNYDLEIPILPNPEEIDNIAYIEQAFVEIKNNQAIKVDMQYFKWGMKQAINRCLVRRDVYRKLIEVQANLPDGLYLKILDAWRPFALQEELFEFYQADIIKTFGLGNVSEDDRRKVLGKYVSLPQRTRYGYPVHTTGGALDVTLVDSQGIDVCMGTRFDEMIPEAQTAYYEKSEMSENKTNRRLLYNTMIASGFTNIPSEWWHYDYGDRFWAFYKNQPAIFGPIFEKEGVSIETV